MFLFLLPCGTAVSYRENVLLFDIKVIASRQSDHTSKWIKINYIKSSNLLCNLDRFFMMVIIVLV